MATEQESRLELHKGWADQILDAGRGVTKWELDFVHDIYYSRIDEGKELSVRQAEILERIYAERTT